MKPLTRRSVTTGLAAAVTAIPAVGLCRSAEGPSELAALIRRYFDGVELVNGTHHETDEELDAHLDQACDAVLRQIAGTPVSSAEDGLAVIDFLIRESCIEESTGIGDFGPAVESMIGALRDYLARGVAT